MNKPAIVTIGNFDGVHLGHQMLLRQVVDRAQALGVRSFAVTFKPHPLDVLYPERRLPRLSTAEERVEMMREFGLDEVWVCDFTPELSRLEPEEFIRMVAERQPIAELWIGADFALGRGRRGTIAVLSDIGANLGWALHMVPPLRKEGQVVSSTGIRTLLAASAVRGAANLLGRPYSVRGTLDDDGHLQVDPMRALPRPGLYEVQALQSGLPIDTMARVLEGPELRLELCDGLRPGIPTTVQFIRRGD
jgi:riboflavin kinase/FMN adenylyltransferase